MKQLDHIVLSLSKTMWPFKDLLRLMIPHQIIEEKELEEHISTYDLGAWCRIKPHQEIISTL
jgi:hypothetical protein